MKANQEKKNEQPNVLLKYLGFKQNFNIFHLAWDNRAPI